MIGILLARTRVQLEQRTQIANSGLLGAADLIVGTDNAQFIERARRVGLAVDRVQADESE